MRKLIVLSVFALLIVTSVQAQVGKAFPAMSAETVNDKVMNIPDDTKGKFTVIGLAYSQKAEEDLGTWLVPLYNTFIHKPEKPSLFSSFAYDVNVFIVPMFTGVKAAAQGTAKKMAAKELDERLHENLLFYKGNLDAYKKPLNMGKKDVPYFFLLDETGKVVYTTSGAYSEQKMDDMETEIVK